MTRLAVSEDEEITHIETLQTKVSENDGSMIESKLEMGLQPKPSALNQVDAVPEKLQTTKKSGRESKSQAEIDPNVIFGMERTYYSALNQSILLSLSGFGLMSVERGLEAAESLGVFLSSCGVFWGVCSWWHCYEESWDDRGCCCCGCQCRRST